MARNSFWKFLIVSIATQVFSSFAYAKSGYVVERIIINGNAHIPQESIVYYLGLTLGSEYSKKEMDRMVQKAYDTGFFKKISVSHSEFKNILLVNVVEQPIISSVKFFGNRSFSDSDLAKVVRLKPGMSFSEAKLKRDVETLLKMYQNSGRFGAIINTKIIENDGCGADVAFEIQEGKKSVIGKIAFIGNTQFSSSELKNNILSREWAFYRFLSGGYTYDPNRLQVDAELISEYYKSHGYPFARVINTTAELDARGEAFALTFEIDSGNKYDFGKVQLNDQIKIRSEREISEALSEIRTGKLFDINAVKAAVEKINEVLARKGYAFATVEYVLNENNNKVDIEIKINPANKFFINQIDIINNHRTWDSVIRREMRISEKDSYDLSKIERSIQRIKNLGYFNEIKFTPKQLGNSDMVDLEIDVDEKRTGTAMFQGGYNTVLGPIFGIRYSEMNLLGSGRNLNANLQFAKLEKSFDISLNEPYFMGYDMTAGINLFYDKRINTNENPQNKSTLGTVKEKYYVATRGLGVQATYDLTEYVRHELNYGLRLENISLPTNQALSMISNFLRADMKTHTVSSIGHVLTYDKTDNIVMPSKGYVVSLAQNFAGLGGDSQYMQNILFAAKYSRLYKDKVIMKISAQCGGVRGLGKKVRMLDNFYSRDSMIRGFEYNGIGPRDARTLDALGGKTYFAGSAEVKFPLGLPQEIGMHGIAFVDTATLYNIDVPKGLDATQNQYFNSKSLRASQGLGIIWDAPVGLMRFEYAIPFSKTKHDQVQKFNFSIGKSF